MTAGDFNGDGIPDVAFAPGGSIFILLGRGDGSFNASLVSTGSSMVTAVAAGDFNGDGKLDLAAANATTGTLVILLGNGDGTFNPLSPVTGTGPGAICVADFNGDGIPDLAVANGQSNYVTVLLGNGDGTFAPTAANLQTGAAPYFVTAADFDGDGIPDMAVLNGSQGNFSDQPDMLTIYRGNGDGTFTQVTKGPGTGTQADGIAVGDFNGDGIADLAVAIQPGYLSSAPGTVSVLTGNGDGTFKVESLTSLPLFNYGLITFLQTGDFNGDGMADLVLQSIGTPPNYELTVLLGDGAGGLSPQVGSGTLNYSPTIGITTGDWNGDGVDDIVATTTESSGEGYVTFLAENQTAVAFIDAMQLPFATNQEVIASYRGDTNYQPSTSGIVTLEGPLGTAMSTVTVTPSAATITDQQEVNLNVTVAGGKGMATPTGSLFFYLSTFGPVLSSGAATFTIPAGTLSPGSNVLTVSYSGDAVYAQQTGTATVTVSPMVMGVSAPSAIPAGGTATATVTLTAGSTYSGTLNLSCTLTTSPANAQSPPTCALNPSTATIAAGGNATTTLTVKTTAATSAMLVRSKDRLWGRGTESAAFAALLMIGLRARRRRWLSILALLVMAICVVSGGCGGSHPTPKPSTPGTTAGTYVFTVKAADSKDATIATSVNVSLAVQ